MTQQPRRGALLAGGRGSSGSKRAVAVAAASLSEPPASCGGKRAVAPRLPRSTCSTRTNEGLSPSPTPQPPSRRLTALHRSFVCGIPLFSSKSLLNFDPAAWQNGHFHDSAVSILDAQVPDPSWVWQWKSWYVDMTGDVDEAGWAYSFSFSPSFAWHGNHVWFHSFVRRRRWLRKRVKLPTPRRRHSHASASADSSRADSVERAGHGLGNDYFTIHSRREPGSWRAGGGGGASSSSYRRSSAPAGDSGWLGDADSDHEDADIANIPCLLRTVRRARLDREKVEAVMRFVEDGGEELTYLADEVGPLPPSCGTECLSC